MAEICYSNLTMLSLSIIILSYNTKSLTLKCLKSVYQQTKEIDFQVIVVDNASTDGSVEAVKKKFPQAEVIANKKNLGYGKANNQGLKKAKGKYILFLNSDTIILDRAIEKSAALMEKRKEIDLLGCRLLNRDKTVQPSGGFFPYLRRVFYQMFFIDDLPLINRLIKPYQQNRKSFYRQLEKVDWASGAFLLLKKKVIEKSGGFAEEFFMYSEEVELCFRAKKAGFQAWFYPGAQVVHLKGQSSKDGFRAAVLGEYQGLKAFYQKHQPGWQMPVLKTILKVGALLRIFIFGILGGNRQKKEVYDQAFKMAG